MSLDRVELGRTGIEVSRLCLGTLPMNQSGMSAQEGADLIVRAWEMGISFVDTAVVYRTHEHVRIARSRLPGLVVATKSHAATYEEMDKDVSRCIEELGGGTIDIFLLHGARARAGVLSQRAGALQCLMDAKRAGRIRAVGISTHHISVVREAGLHQDIDVIHPLINMAGLGIADGGVEEMAQAIDEASRRGKGIYLMKTLAGGNLIPRREEALRFAASLPGVHCVAVGMVSVPELLVNTSIFEGRPIPEDAAKQTKAGGEKWFLLAPACRGCGKCVEMCPSEALAIVDGKCRVDRARCVLCRYCGPVCPEFAIRFV
ncbi:MAG: aldo/keto reductase [Firmicutes bacterium]|jgi:aryl-alcohol dehydrogenase-like predicted oxidoreductase|nr:aldo/keto reductase [Bacillota bacterium]